MVTDIEFLPLTSQDAANKALTSLSAARKEHEAGTDSELSESESETARDRPAEEAAGPHTDDEQTLPRSASDTSIAQDVLTKKGNFGRFASQWFSRQGWSGDRSSGVQKTPSTPAEVKGSKVAEGDAVEAAKPEQAPEQVGSDTVPDVKHVIDSGKLREKRF